MVRGSYAEDVKQKALKITWEASTKPTKEKLLSTFRPFGAIVCVEIKEKCAAVLFADVDAVAAAVKRSWDEWDVRPMTTTSKAVPILNNPTSRDAPRKGTRPGTGHPVCAGETANDGGSPGAVEGMGGSRSRAAMRGRVTLSAWKKSVAVAARKRGGSRAVLAEGEVPAGPARKSNIQKAGQGLKCEDYTIPSTPSAQNDRGKTGSGGARSNSKQSRTVRRRRHGRDSPKKRLSTADHDPSSPRSAASLSSLSEDKGSTHARRSPRSKPRRRRSQRNRGSEDATEEGRHACDIGETSRTREPNTKQSARIVGHETTGVDGSGRAKHSESVSSPPKPDTLAAASSESDICRQEPSPLSSPEELQTSMRERDAEGGPGEATHAGAAEARGCSSRGGGHANPGRHQHDSVESSANRGGVGSADNDMAPPFTSAASPEVLDERDAPISAQQPDVSRCVPDVAGLSTPATAAPTETAYVLDVGEVEDIDAGPDDRMGVEQEKHVSLRGEEQAGAAPQTRAKEQAKRLALEVARLRSALRGTVSDLKMERAARERLEGEWWQKFGEWNEERGCLFTAKQEAERASRVAEEEVSRMRKQDQDREAKVVSDQAARETAQFKTESALNGVAKVQDRLICALQTELDITNRAREAAQEDAREAKEQLRLYVGDFLLWRDRATRLQARMVELGLPQPLLDSDDGSLPSSGWPSASKLPQCPTISQHARCKMELASRSGAAAQGPNNAASSQRKKDGDNTSSGDMKSAGSAGSGSPTGEVSREPEENHATIDNGPSLMSTGRGRSGLEGDGNINGVDLSVPERSEKHFDQTRPVPNALGGNMRKYSLVSEAVAAWSAGSAIGGCSSSSRAYFQRSMKAQQEISARLERDLVKARADLQQIYAGNKEDRDGGTPIYSSPTKTAAGSVSVEGNAEIAPLTEVRDEAGRERGGGSENGDFPLRSYVAPRPDEAITYPQHGIGQGSVGGGNDVVQNSMSPVAITGPRMARVLAALLGAGSKAETATGSMRTRMPVYDATGMTERGHKSCPSHDVPPSLRLSDYPPMIQSVFCGGTSVLPSPPDMGLGGVAVMGKPVGKTHRNMEVTQEQTRSYQHDLFTALSTGTTVSGETRAGNNTDGPSFNRPTAVVPPEYHRTSAATSGLIMGGRGGENGQVALCGEETRTAEAAASGVESSQSCALARAFREYEAKSPLLQRWLAERIPSSRNPVV